MGQLCSFFFLVLIWLILKLWFEFVFWLRAPSILYSTVIFWWEAKREFFSKEKQEKRHQSPSLKPWDRFWWKATHILEIQPRRRPLVFLRQRSQPYRLVRRQRRASRHLLWPQRRRLVLRCLRQVLSIHKQTHSFTFFFFVTKNFWIILIWFQPGIRWFWLLVQSA